MRRQLIGLLSGAIGVVILTTIATVQASPLNSVEKATNPQISMTKGRGGLDFSEVEDLNLTAEQEEDIDTIKASTHEELADILTAEQMEAFEEGQANGDDMRSVMMGLGLTSEQRSDLMGLMQASRDEIMEVLTPEQQAQLEGERPRDRN